MARGYKTLNLFQYDMKIHFRYEVNHNNQFQVSEISESVSTTQV